MAKKKKPAQDRHAAAITITSPPTLTKADVTFSVERDDERLGTLYVSRGAVAWKPNKGKTNYKSHGHASIRKCCGGCAPKASRKDAGRTNRDES